MNLGKTLASAASAGLLMGAIGCGDKSQAPDVPTAPAAGTASDAMQGGSDAATDAMGDASDAADSGIDAAAKACCKGMNACKGKGACHVEGANTCAGKNECKGKGGCNGHCPN